MRQASDLPWTLRANFGTVNFPLALAVEDTNVSGANRRIQEETTWAPVKANERVVVIFLWSATRSRLQSQGVIVTAGKAVPAAHAPDSASSATHCCGPRRGHS